MKRYEQDPKFKMNPIFMTEDALSQLYSARPVVSSDIIFCDPDTKSVYLTTRTQTPGEGLWVVGGARKCGETAEQTASRRVKAETGLEIDVDRFKLIGIIEYIWPYRHEEPKNEGRHDINFVFGLPITGDEIEIARHNLDPNEYNIDAGFRRFSSVDDLEAAGVKPIIIDYYNELFNL